MCFEVCGLGRLLERKLTIEVIARVCKPAVSEDAEGEASCKAAELDKRGVRSAACEVQSASEGDRISVIVIILVVNAIME